MRYYTVIFILIILNSCISRKQEIIRDENGVVISKCELKNGFRHGICYHYYPNGSIEGISSWNKGVQDGETIEYYENGNVRSTTMIKGGKQDGICINYYENGNVHITSMWKEGKLNGERVEYYENGNIKERGNGVNGQPIEIEYYDEHGRLQKVYDYIVINHKSKLNGIVVYDVDNANNYPYNIKHQESTAAQIFAVRDTIEYGSFMEYKVRYACSLDHWIYAYTGKIDQNFNVLDDSTIKEVDLENLNRFYPTNLGTDTLRVVFEFMKYENGSSLLFECYLEKVFTVIEKDE